MKQESKGLTQITTEHCPHQQLPHVNSKPNNSSFIYIAVDKFLSTVLSLPLWITLRNPAPRLAPLSQWLLLCSSYLGVAHSKWLELRARSSAWQCCCVSRGGRCPIISTGHFLAWSAQVDLDMTHFEGQSYGENKNVLLMSLVWYLKST